MEKLSERKMKIPQICSLLRQSHAPVKPYISQRPRSMMWLGQESETSLVKTVCPSQVMANGRLETQTSHWNRGSN